jgi:hypothetical protein
MMPLWLYRIVEPIADLLALPIAAVLAIKGKYPWWLLTPDDQVSPFGCGTTPGASNEPTMRAVYKRLGRYVGDVWWLGRRNRMYGLAYAMKPDWLKRPGLRYLDVAMWKAGDSIYLRQPDDTVLRERTIKLGFLYLIVGHRLSPIWNAHYEELERHANGLPPIGRPLHHPNMDARPIVTVRSKRTL